MNCWCKELAHYQCLECESISRWNKASMPVRIKLILLAKMIKKDLTPIQTKEAVEISIWLDERDYGIEDLPRSEYERL